MDTDTDTCPIQTHLILKVYVLHSKLQPWCGRFEKINDVDQCFIHHLMNTKFPNLNHLILNYIIAW
jgi:hypothetical protein